MNGSLESPEPLSEKAQGKRRAPEDDNTATVSSNGASTQKRVRARKAISPLDKIPTGPLLNPHSLGRRLLATQPRIKSNAFVPARAAVLPLSEHFIDQLRLDIEALLETFCSTWSREGAESGLLALFVRLWKESGWHLIALAWGEDLRTRQRFFEVTTRCCLEVGQQRNERVSNSATHLLRQIGSLFAAYLLWLLQTRLPNPVPGLAKAAYDWARLPREVDEDTFWDPLGDARAMRISIPINDLEALLALPQKVEDLQIGPSREASSSPSEDLSYVLRHMLGCSPSIGRTEAAQISPSAFYIIPSSVDHEGIQDPPSLPVLRIASSEERQRSRGAYGTVRSSELPGDQWVDGEPGLSRADLLLSRAHEALEIPQSQPHAAPDELLLYRQTADHPASSSSSRARQGPPVALFNGVWLERPFRPMSLPRLHKWQQSLEETEERREEYEEEALRGRRGLLAQQGEAQPTDASSLLYVDLAPYEPTSGDRSERFERRWSALPDALSIDDSPEAIFELARRMTEEKMREGARRRDHGQRETKSRGNTVTSKD